MGVVKMVYGRNTTEHEALHCMFFKLALFICPSLQIKITHTHNYMYIQGNKVLKMCKYY